MADQTYDQLLASIGFPAADASRESAIISRKRELGQAGVQLQGEEERRGMAADYEARGVLTSGEANLGYARQGAREANQLSQLDVAAAEDLFNVQRQMEREKAEKDAADRQFALQKTMFDEQMGLQRSQVDAQRAYQAELDRIQYQAQQEAAARNAFDWEAFVRWTTAASQAQPVKIQAPTLRMW